MTGSAFRSNSSGRVFTSAYSSPPASPVEGDIWLPSDSFYMLRRSASAWVPWGPLFPFTLPPDDAGLSWSNQGGATSDDSDGSLFIAVTNGSSEVLRTLHKTAPATPWTLTVAFLFTSPPTATGYCGLVFRESSSGKTHAFRVHHDGSISSTKHDSAGAGVAHYVQTSILPPAGCYWFRIADNGTNRVCSFSSDGEEWATVHTVGRTDYLTADQAGIFVGGNNSARVAMRVLSWTGV